MKVEIRSATEAVIEGYVNAVERESRPIHSIHGTYTERVASGTFQKALNSGKSVELRFNHQKVLDSTDGSLELREDNIGLYAKALIHDEEVIEKARRGELRGWSFGFRDNNPKIENAKRVLSDIELREVSILTKTPAYIATSIEMRGEETEVLEERGIEDKVEVTEIEKREQKVDLDYKNRLTISRAFEAYIRGQINETRSGEQNVTMGNNGAVIPVTIANKVIHTIKDISTVFSRATMYTVKGTLKIPVWGNANSTHNITVGYQEEFTDITADAGKFTSVDLGGYLAGALSLIGKSVINNAQVDVVSFIVTEMARKIAEFLEHELLVGTGSNAAQGIATGCTNTLTTAATAITADELITLQSKVKQAYQKDAIWIIGNDTFTAIKKLKDGDGNYLLQNDFTKEFPYTLLGKPVEVSDNMPSMEANAVR